MLYTFKIKLRLLIKQDDHFKGLRHQTANIQRYHKIRVCGKNSVMYEGELICHLIKKKL